MTDPLPPASEPRIRPAETRLRAQLEADPGQHDLALLLGDLLLGDGRSEEAVELLWAHCEDRACGDMLREYFVGERRSGEAQRLLERRGSDASASGLVDKAIASHLRGDLESAMTCCRLAQSADPNYVPAWNHLGRALFNARRATAARAEFVHAVRMAPDYAEAWHNLAHVLRDAQEFEQAERAYGHALRLRPAYRSALLNLGIVLAAMNRPDDALLQFEKLLAIDPDNAEAWFNLALCQHLLRRFDDARESYERAIAYDPRNLRVHLQYGRLLNERFDTAGALDQFRRALDIDPRDPETWGEIANVHEQANNLAEADRAIVAGLSFAPNDPGLKLAQAKLARRRGDVEATLAILRGIDLKSLHPRLHQQYQYELGWALDRAGESAAAIAAFEQANAMASRSPRAQGTDAQAFDRQLDAIETWLADDAPTAAHDADEDAGEDLCFLLGFPRSGTTLLDVMLAGHPDVAAIEEQPTIERLAQTLGESAHGYPNALVSLDRAGRDALRSQYRRHVADLLGGRAGAARLIVDKMPIRSVHAGFIQRLFPRARILFSLRHPCDVVLSNYMQHYAANEINVHFHTLAETARIYDRAMQVWEKTFATIPLRNTYLRYEDLIEDASRTLREACDFLGLPWRDELTEHRKHLKGRDRIATHSYHQVAEPIYGRAVGRWERYRDALAPCLPTLRPHAEHFGYRID